MSTLDPTASGLAAGDARTNERTMMRQPMSFDYYAFDGHKLGGGYGVTINVGEGGMLFETEKVLDVMTTVLVEVVSPVYAFMATGHIVHVHQIDDTLYNVGMRFNDVIQGGWELLLEQRRPLWARGLLHHNDEGNDGH